MTKKTLLLSTLIGFASVGLLLSPHVFAESTPGSDPMSALVQKIADKFGLNKSDVQAVFDADRTERQARMQAENETRLTERLTQLVTDGKITESQKTLILAKHKELQAARQSEMESMNGKTDAERKTIMDTHRTALESWAKQNGIDIQYVIGLGGPKGIGGHGGRFGAPPVNPTGTPAP